MSADGGHRPTSRLRCSSPRVTRSHMSSRAAQRNRRPVRSTPSLAFSGAWGPQGYAAAHVARVCWRYCRRYRLASPRHPPDCPRRSRHCPDCPGRLWSSSQPHHSKRHLRPNSHRPHRLRLRHRLLLRRHRLEPWLLHRRRVQLSRKGLAHLQFYALLFLQLDREPQPANWCLLKAFHAFVISARPEQSN
jgi:hypothetical protein